MTLILLFNTLAVIQRVSPIGAFTAAHRQKQNGIARLHSSTLLLSSFDIGYDYDHNDLHLAGVSSPSHEVHRLDDPRLAYEDDLFEGEEANEESLGRAIAKGEAVACVPGIASDEECLSLFEAALGACEGRGPAARGRSRFSVSDPRAFSSDVVLTCEEMLLRVLDYLDEEVPSVYETLFRPGPDWVSWQPLDARLEERTVPPEEYLAETCPSLRELYMMGELEWSEGEPAINVYQDDGYFGAHKDHLALTVLIPLTSPEDFSGGGTGFWAGNRMADENPQGPPDLVLKPSPGSALIFGGDVTHAGLAVESGYRSVFVCSFSTRTPASPEDRLHGMQAPPKVSANFKGTT